MITTRDLEEDLELVRSAAIAAGVIATGYFRSDVTSWRKSDGSPVSAADIEVDDYLHEILTGERPDHGWVSEEWGERDRLERSRVFIVDPIDGTRAFLRGEDTWTISIAIVEAGLPMVGAVYAPARDELYDALLGGGARLNGTPLSAGGSTSIPVISGPTAVHRELRDLGLDYTRGESLPSLAYRLMQLSTRKFDAVVAKRGSSDWDIAAATLILSESGCTLEEVCQGPPAFDRESTRLEPLAAARDAQLLPTLREALKAVYGCPPGEQGEAMQPQS